MTPHPPGSPGREEVIAILARLGSRSPGEVTEKIGSLEVAWLISEVEQRYKMTLDLSDEAMAQLQTLSGAVATLQRLLMDAGDG